MSLDLQLQEELAWFNNTLWDNYSKTTIRAIQLCTALVSERRTFVKTSNQKDQLIEQQAKLIEILTQSIEKTVEYIHE